MKKYNLKSLSVFGLALLGAQSIGMLSTSQVYAAELEIDPAHSSVGFAIKHLRVATVHGNFTDFSGKIDLVEKEPLKSKVEFTVKATSINTSNAKRDEHLRSSDFFDVQKFPLATFVSKTIKKENKKKDGMDVYSLEGDLTMHGVTKSAKFSLVSLGRVKDPYGNEKYMFQAETTLVRKDYGLVYNAALESGGFVLGEDVKLVVDIEAVATKPAAQK